MAELPHVAVIGVGNMGEALVRGLLDRGILRPSDLTGAEKVLKRAEEVAGRHGFRVVAEVCEACRSAEVVLLAVKPQDVDSALKDLGPCAAGKLLVSVCAGITLGRLEGSFPQGQAVVRVMPNGPALVGCGASVYVANAHVKPHHKAWVEALFGAVGEVYSVEEEALLDAVTGLSGSGPAYAYLVMEALADGGVLMGLPRDLSRALACQTLLGSARMARDSGLHTAELKDRVASPGGTTIAGLRELELRGVRAAVMEAVRVGTLRSRELGG